MERTKKKSVIGFDYIPAKIEMKIPSTEFPRLYRDIVTEAMKDGGRAINVLICHGPDVDSMASARMVEVGCFCSI